MSLIRQDRWRFVASVVGITVGSLAYVLTLLDHSTSFTRTANGLGYASNFFDLQARAFMEGNLHVPMGSLGIEGFHQRGLEYMYFQPWPAIVRIPVLLTTSEFDGELTVFFMAIAFILLVVMATRLVWLVRDMMAADRQVGGLEGVSMAVLLACVLGGTTLTYDASLPWVYHEVYAWVIPFCVGAMYWMLRTLRDPQPASIAWMGVFCLGAVMTRTTGGWAMCLGAFLVGGWLLLDKARPQTRYLARWAAGAGLAAVLAGVVFNYLKFRHPYMFPLEDQVWSDLNEHRRRALEVNGGTITGLQFFWTSFVAYFRLDGVRFVDYFPWATLPPTPAEGVNGAFLDQSYRTGSVSGLMPWLLLLTVAAVLIIARPGVSREMKMLRIPLAAGIFVSGGVMAYGYLATRYTSDFVPGVVMGGIIATCAMNAWMIRNRSLLMGPFVALAALATAYSIVVNMLIGHTAAAFTAGGVTLGEYLQRQHDLSPDAQAPLVKQYATRPAFGAGRADEIAVVGDCQALYFNTGDKYVPWVLVERRNDTVVATIKPMERARNGRILLYESLVTPSEKVWLVTNKAGRARVVIENESGEYKGYWFEVPPPYEVRIGIRDIPHWEYAEVSSTPGGWVGYIKAAQWDREAITHAAEIVTHARNDWEARVAGVDLRVEPGVPLRLCRTLAENAGLELAD
ncbi:hypothetical protein [Nocardioides solisilvae]|uniref:hypothetical protein n=1 Tax=Nocardioides solisilvae TaxID=1542435 RepID=UPI000D747C26|nr:hypothetical protein [Nocardioides solisilvae]